MKKTYEKPVVIIEDFALCENIALGCEVKATHAQNECAFNDNGWMTFTSTVADCTDVQWDQESAYTDNSGEKVCYHVPVAANNIFTS